MPVCEFKFCSLFLIGNGTKLPLWIIAAIRLKCTRKAESVQQNSLFPSSFRIVLVKNACICILAFFWKISWTATKHKDWKRKKSENPALLHLMVKSSFDCTNDQFKVNRIRCFCVTQFLLAFLFLRLAEMIAVSGTAATHKLWLSQRQLVDRKEI